MYNEEIKQEFINTIKESSQLTHKTLFKTTSKLEEEENIDLFCIPKDVIAKYFMTNTGCNSLKSLQSKISIAIRYQKWANEKGLVPPEYRAVPYEKIDLKEIFMTYNKLDIFRSPAEVRELINERFMQRSYRGVTTELLLSAYISLLYSGFRDSEIFELSVENTIVSDSNIVITTKDKNVIIHDEFYDIIKEVATNRMFMSLTMQTYGERPMDNRFLDNGGKLSDKALKTTTKQLTRERLSGIHMRTEDLYVMGMIYRNMPYGYDGYDRFERMDFLKKCWGDKPTQAQREKTYRLLELWEKPR